jgi:hypothetical protein
MRYFKNGNQRTWDSFFLVPQLDTPSLVFHATVALVAIIDVCLQLIMTADGPNLHDGDREVAHFPQMPTSESYYIGRMTLNIMLLIVALCEVVSSFHQWYMSGRHFANLINAVQLFSVVAFFVVVYIYPPHKVEEGYASQAVHFTTTKDILGTIEMGKLLWVLSFANVLTEVQALMLTFRNTRRALMVPLAMLFITNSISGSAIYFLEPCFNRDECPFQNMFRSFFFGLVTMARVGYGDQNPAMFYTRVLVVITMLMGGVFFAMPLAIITQKYDQAYKLCTMLKEEMRIENEGALIGETMEETLSKMQARQLSKGNEHENLKPRLEVFANHNSLIENLSQFVKELEALAMKGRRQSTSLHGNLKLVNVRQSDGIKSSTKKVSLRAEQAVIEEMLRQGINEGNSDDEHSVKSDDEVTGIGPPRSLLNRILPPILLQGTKMVSLSRKPGAVSTTPTMKVIMGSPQVDLSTDGFSSPREHDGLVLRADHSLKLPRCAKEGGSPARNFVVSEVPTSVEKRSQRMRLIRQEIATRDEKLKKNFEKLDDEQRALGDMAFPADMSRCIIAHRDSINKLVYEYTQWLLVVIPNAESASETKKGLKFNIQKAMRQLKEEKTRSMVTGKSAGPGTGQRGRGGAIMKIKKLDLKEELTKTVEMAQANSWRFQLFLVLEMPYASIWASRVSTTISSFGVFSLLVFMLQSMSVFHVTGETSQYCETALESYCSNKFDASLDAGCYSTYGNKLEFGCDEPDCFGQGGNFGSPDPTLTCDSTYGPFQEASTLDELTLFSSQLDFQHNSPLCMRVECASAGLHWLDGNIIWPYLETIVFVVFTLELAARFTAATIHMNRARDVLGFFLNSNIIFDVLAVLPFFIEMTVNAATTSKAWPDFNTLSSLPIAPIMNFVRWLKVLRLIKVGRHMRSVKIVVQTIRKCHMKVLVNVALLLLFSLPCGYLLYILERGTPCFANDTDDGGADEVCGVSISELPLHWQNKYLMVSPDTNSLSLLPNAFYGYWLTLVTITAEGYGKIYAVTVLGKLLTVVLIIVGSIYLSIPVAVMCDTFHTCFKEVVEDERKMFDRMRKMIRKVAQAKGVRAELTLEAPPVMETGDPDVDRALMKSTVTNKLQLTRSIKELVSNYYNVREVMARGIVTANGDPMIYVHSLRQALRQLCATTGKVRHVQKDMQLYRVMEA